MSKNIAFFTSDITIHGGTQRVVTILANAFKNMLGHNVYIYSLKHSKNKPEYELEPNIKLVNINLDYKLSNFSRIIKLINNLNKENSIDSILGIGCYFNYFCLL